MPKHHPPTHTTHLPPPISNLLNLLINMKFELSRVVDNCRFWVTFFWNFCQGWRVPRMTGSGNDAAATASTTNTFFVKDDENNLITSVCLSVQKGVVSNVIKNFKMFGSGWKLVWRQILECRLEKWRTRVIMRGWDEGVAMTSPKISKCSHRVENWYRDRIR